MSAPLNVGGYKQFSATGNISTVPVSLLGFIISTSTSGTLTIYDDPATGTTIKAIDTTAALTGGTFVSMPISLSKGLYVVVGGTISATAVFAP
jgi:hypothetical protein